MTKPNPKVNDGLQKAPPVGRRNADQTKKRILAAARSIFARQGYAYAGVREIAAMAGINAALVIRYFGSKENLFAMVLEKELTLDRLWSGNREDFGRNVAEILLGSDDKGANNPLPMLMLSFSDPVAREIVLTIIERDILRPLALKLGGADAEERASEILALTAGFSMYRQLLPLRAFSGKIAASTRRWLEISLQEIVDGD